MAGLLYCIALHHRNVIFQVTLCNFNILIFKIKKKNERKLAMVTCIVTNLSLCY